MKNKEGRGGQTRLVQGGWPPQGGEGTLPRDAHGYEGAAGEAWTIHSIVILVMTLVRGANQVLIAPRKARHL